LIITAMSPRKLLRTFGLPLEVPRNLRRRPRGRYGAFDV